MAQTTKLVLVPIDIDDPADLAFTFHLRNANREFFFSNRRLRYDYHIKWLTKKDTDPDFGFFIIMCGHERVGTIAAEFRDSCIFLQNLCVDAKFRGRGIAKQAIKLLMLPKRFIIAQVKPDNKKVIKMYEKLGFWQVKR